jgi:group I intron endonuclease
MDYNNGKIYCILNYINSDVYVGSTCSMLHKRMHEHRAKANYTTRTYGSKAPIHQAMNELGPEHFYIELIEPYPCKSKDELKAREGHYIRERGTLNMLIAGRTKKEYIKDNQEHIKEYCKTWHEANRERLLDKQQQTYTCQCGKTLTWCKKARHEKSLRHQNYLNRIYIESDE